MAAAANTFPPSYLKIWITSRPIVSSWTLVSVGFIGFWLVKMFWHYCETHRSGRCVFGEVHFAEVCKKGQGDEPEYLHNVDSKYVHYKCVNWRLPHGENVLSVLKRWYRRLLPSTLHKNLRTENILCILTVKENAHCNLFLIPLVHLRWAYSIRFPVYVVTMETITY